MPVYRLWYANLDVYVFVSRRLESFRKAINWSYCRPTASHNEMERYFIHVLIRYRFWFKITLIQLKCKFISVLLAVVSACTAIGAYHWLSDPTTAIVPFSQSLWNHPFFTFTSVLLSEFRLCFNYTRSCMIITNYFYYFQYFYSSPVYTKKW